MDSQRRSDADIRKQAQHHPAYTEADILFVAAEQTSAKRSIHHIRKNEMTSFAS